MERQMKKLFVILVIALSFIIVPSAFAETVEVTGVITAITTSPNVVEVDGTAVYGVKLDYLCNQYNICLVEGETVSFSTYEYFCKLEGGTKLMATSITVGDVTVQFR